MTQWFWRRRFLNFVNVFSLFRNYLPLEKEGALHLNNLESPLPKDDLCHVIFEIGPVVLEKKIFLILSMYFRYFAIISLSKRRGPFSWTILNTLYLRMLCAKFGWNSLDNLILVAKRFKGNSHNVTLDDCVIFTYNKFALNQTSDIVRACCIHCYIEEFFRQLHFWDISIYLINDCSNDIIFRKHECIHVHVYDT